jgi:hypothetical protein
MVHFFKAGLARQGEVRLKGEQLSRQAGAAPLRKNGRPGSAGARLLPGIDSGKFGLAGSVYGCGAG